MKTYKKIAIITLLSLVSLSTFSMVIVPKESMADKALRKKLYAWHAGNRVDKPKCYIMPMVSSIIAQSAQFAVNRVSGSKKQLNFDGEKKFLEESCDYVYEKLTNMGVVPKKIVLTRDEINGASKVLNNHVITLKSKITANENPWQAKWKNMAKAVAVTGATFGLAYCYLHNKQAANEFLGNNFISHNATHAAQHYYEAPYRPFIAAIFNRTISDALSLDALFFGSFICGHVSRLVRLFIDRLIGFTHFVPSGQNFLGLSKNGRLYDALSLLFVDIPATYISNQFSKVWYYKSDLIKRKKKDEDVLSALFNVPLEKRQDSAEREQINQFLNMVGQRLSNMFGPRGGNGTLGNPFGPHGGNKTLGNPFVQRGGGNGAFGNPFGQGEGFFGDSGDVNEDDKVD